MKIHLIDKSAASKAEASLFFVEQDFDKKSLKTIAEEFCPELFEFMKKSEFTGKAQSVFVLPCAVNKKMHTLI